MKDTIRINVSECSWEEPEEIWNEEIDNYEETGKTVINYDISCAVEINGKEIEHYTDLSAFLREFVHKSVVSNFADWCGESYKDTGTKYIPITKAWRYRLTDFYPFTCSCGVAGCSSIWDGIHVKWRKNSVEWRIKDKRDGYEKILDKRFYSFCRYNYEEEILVAWEDLVDIVKKNPNNKSSWMVDKYKSILKGERT